MRGFECRMGVGGGWVGGWGPCVHPCVCFPFPYRKIFKTLFEYLSVFVLRLGGQLRDSKDLLETSLTTKEKILEPNHPSEIKENHL